MDRVNTLLRSAARVDQLLMLLGLLILMVLLTLLLNVFLNCDPHMSRFSSSTAWAMIKSDNRSILVLFTRSFLLLIPLVLLFFASLFCISANGFGSGIFSHIHVHNRYTFWMIQKRENECPFSWSQNTLLTLMRLYLNQSTFWMLFFWLNQSTKCSFNPFFLYRINLLCRCSLSCWTDQSNLLSFFVSNAFSPS